MAAVSDPWRKLAQTQLRSDESAFGLARLGLPVGAVDAGGEGAQTVVERVAAALVEILGQRPDLRWRLDWRRRETRPVPAPTTDLTLARYNAELVLDGVTGVLDEADPLPELAEDRRRALEDELARAHQAVRGLRAELRADRLASRAARAAAKDPAGARYLGRLLTGTWLSVLPGAARMPPPRPPAGLGALHFWVRPDDGTFDLWTQVQHIALDGAPVQELLREVAARFGAAGRPASGVIGLGELADATPVRCSTGRSAAVDVVTGAVDLAPALAMRTREAPELPVAGLVAWLLSGCAAFTGEVFCAPVDLPRRPERARTTRLAVIRPVEHRSLAGYAEAFAAELAAARADRNAFAAALRRAAALPPRLADVATRLAPGQARRQAGGVGVTVLRDVDVFVAPFSRVYRAYVAVARVAAEDQRGRRWAAVSVKAPADRLPAYRDEICAALSAPRLAAGR